MDYYSSLQIREIFHVEFLSYFSRKFKPTFYTLKGGVNMRLYFKSKRYSEDMDMDVSTIDTITLRDSVMKILTSAPFINNLKPFGIENVLPPDMSKAKQTNTTQRFKIHLVSHNNEDLFTKVEFSRRETFGHAVVESIPESVLRPYKISPLIISHYDIDTAYIQKVNALANRKAVQARDIFDIYTLSTQFVPKDDIKKILGPKVVKTACENLFCVSFNQFRDTVLSYLLQEDKEAYDNPEIWDEIKLKVNEMICR